jgi:hypothetical protein
VNIYTDMAQDGVLVFHEGVGTPDKNIFLCRDFLAPSQENDRTPTVSCNLELNEDIQ